MQRIVQHASNANFALIRSQKANKGLMTDEVTLLCKFETASFNPKVADSKEV